MTRIFRQVGDEATIVATFTLNSTGTNPDNVSAQTITPAGVTANVSPTASGNGIYYFNLYLAAEGVHYWQVAGSGTVNAAVYGEITVRDTPFH